MTPNTIILRMTVVILLLWSCRLAAAQDLLLSKPLIDPITVDGESNPRSWLATASQWLHNVVDSVPHQRPRLLSTVNASNLTGCFANGTDSNGTACGTNTTTANATTSNITGNLPFCGPNVTGPCITGGNTSNGNITGNLPFCGPNVTGPCITGGNTSNGNITGKFTTESPLAAFRNSSLPQIPSRTISTMIDRGSAIAGADSMASFPRTSGLHALVTTGAPTVANMLTIQAAVRKGSSSSSTQSLPIISNLLPNNHTGLRAMKVGDKAVMFELAIVGSDSHPVLTLATATMQPGANLTYVSTTVRPQSNCWTCSISYSWYDITFVRGVLDTKLYRNKDLVATLPPLDMSVDTSVSSLARTYPPLIGARYGLTTAISETFDGYISEIRAFSVPLSAESVATVSGKSLSPTALPPSLVMLYDFEAPVKCDPSSANVESGGDSIILEDAVGSRPAAITLSGSGLVHEDSQSRAITAGGVLPTVGDGEFAISAASTSGDLASWRSVLTSHGIALNSFSGAPIVTLTDSYSTYTALRPSLVACARCGGRVSHLPDGGISGLADVALEVPLGPGTCKSGANEGESCVNVPMGCRRLTEDGRISAVPLPLRAKTIFPRQDGSSIVCAAARPLRGSDEDIASNTGASSWNSSQAISGTSAFIVVSADGNSQSNDTLAAAYFPLLRFRWSAGAQSAMAAATIAASGATVSRPACLPPASIYNMAAGEIGSLVGIGATAAMEGASVQQEKIWSLITINQGVPIAGIAPGIDGLSQLQSVMPPLDTSTTPTSTSPDTLVTTISDEAKAKLSQTRRAFAISMIQPGSIPGSLLPTASLAFIGVSLAPNDPLTPTAQAMIAGSVLTEIEFRTTMHSRNQLRRMLRIGRPRAFGQAVTNPAAGAVYTDGTLQQVRNSSLAGGGLLFHPHVLEVASQPVAGSGTVSVGAPVTFANTLILDSSAWRGMLPIKYHRSAVNGLTEISSTAIVGKDTTALRIRRTAPRAASTASPGSSSGLASPPGPRVSPVDPYASPGGSIGIVPPVYQLNATASRTKVSETASIRWLLCDRAEPEWPRWPGGATSTITVAVKARVPLQGPNGAFAPNFLAMVKPLLEERIGLSTPPWHPGQASETWMGSDSSGAWLREQEVWITFDSSSLTVSVHDDPTILAEIVGGSWNDNSTEREYSKNTTLQFSVHFQTRLKIAIPGAAVDIDLVPQLPNIMVSPGNPRISGSSQFRATVDAAHHLSRAIALASGHGESWAQRQQCRARLL